MQGEGSRRNEKMIRKRIFKNTFSNSIGKILSFAFQMAIVSYLVKNLGKEAYGSIVLALALAANIQLLEAGFGIGVTKNIIEFWSVSIIRVAEGFQKYFAVRLIEVAKWGLRLLFVVIAVKNGYGLTGVGLAYL